VDLDEQNFLDICRRLDGKTAGIHENIPVSLTNTGTVAVKVSVDVWLNNVYQRVFHALWVNPGGVQTGHGWFSLPGRHVLTMSLMQGPATETAQGWKPLREQGDVVEKNCTFVILPSPATTQTNPVELDEQNFLDICRRLDGKTAGLHENIPVSLTNTGTVAVKVSVDVWLNNVYQRVFHALWVNPGGVQTGHGWFSLPGRHVLTMSLMQGPATETAQGWKPLREQGDVVEKNCTFVILPSPATTQTNPVELDEQNFLDICRRLDGKTAGLHENIPVSLTNTGTVAVKVSVDVWLNNVYQRVFHALWVNPGGVQTGHGWFSLPGRHVLTMSLMQGPATETAQGWKPLREQGDVVEKNCTFVILPSPAYTASLVQPSATPVLTPIFTPAPTLSTYSLHTFFDPDLSACRQEKSFTEITRASEWGTRYFTGGLGKLMKVEEYEVWICDKGDPCSPVGDMMCYVFNERLRTFEPLALHSRLQFVK
jgi:hypothetical protein